MGLPNGQTVATTKEGIVQLTDTLVLQHVLFVLKLQCNLISVSQFVDDLNCAVHFTSNACTIQDQHLREVIGTGERLDGLYYMRQGLTVQAVSFAKSKSLELWHHRLGHPSEKIT